MHPGIYEAGCDEAGRGCLCGPVCCAAVILPEGFTHPDLNDSKKLSEKKRNALRIVIEREALAWKVAMIGPSRIDEINILQASIEGMHEALEGLSTLPQHILVDGNKFKPWRDIPFTTVIKGDSKYASIAAASILAKTHRDEIIYCLAKEYPQYNWQHNKGYPTKDHKEALARFGLTPYHRRTYAPCKTIPILED